MISIALGGCASHTCVPRPFHFGQRDLSPTQQRWIEQDPIGYKAGDSNLYRFVGNNPVTRTDPSGLTSDDYYEGNGWAMAGDFLIYVGVFDRDINGPKTRIILGLNNALGGFSDTITGGATQKLRVALDIDTVDRESDMYRYGTYAGQAYNIATMVANPIVPGTPYLILDFLNDLGYVDPHGQNRAGCCSRYAASHHPARQSPRPGSDPFTTVLSMICFQGKELQLHSPGQVFNNNTLFAARRTATPNSLPTRKNIFRPSNRRLRLAIIYFIVSCVNYCPISVRPS